MDIVSRNRMMVFSGGSNEPLAEEVVEVLGIPLGRIERSTFANGEIYVRAVDSVRGADCFVIQSHDEPINDNIMEQLIMIDSLKRASARSITAVMPFFGYSRQDKKVLPREPITARLMSDLFMRAGADRLVSEIRYMLSLVDYEDREKPAILTTVAVRNEGIDQLKVGIRETLARRGKERRMQRRREQAEDRLRTILSDRLLRAVLERALSDGDLARVIGEIAERRTDPYSAAQRVLDRVEVR